MENSLSWESKLDEVSSDNRVVLLQYNTHLFEWAEASRTESGLRELGDISNFYNEKIRQKKDFKKITIDPFCFEDDQRKHHIVEKIRELKPDIVALNEVWSEDNMDWFIKSLKDILPHHAKGPLDSKVIQTSGLVLLSNKNYTIEAHDIHIYKKRDWTNVLGTKFPKNINEENWANKGVLVALMCRPGGKKFIISITHTAGLIDIDELVDFTSKKAKDWNHDGPIIVTGDLNVHESHRPQMEKLFEEKLNAKDVWNYQNISLFSDIKGNTIDNVNNQLFHKLHPSRKVLQSTEGNVDRLDYVFYASPVSPDKDELYPIAARVIQDWSYTSTVYKKHSSISTVPVDLPSPVKDHDEIIDLSDHYPLEVIFGPL